MHASLAWGDLLRTDSSTWIDRSFPFFSMVIPGSLWQARQSSLVWAIAAETVRREIKKGTAMENGERRDRVIIVLLLVPETSTMNC
jgi:hypothetical protein